MSLLYDMEEEFRKGMLEAALDRVGGNRTKAAQSLGVERPYFCRLLKRYGLNRSPNEAARLTDLLRAALNSNGVTSTSGGSAMSELDTLGARVRELEARAQQAERERDYIRMEFMRLRGRV